MQVGKVYNIQHHLAAMGMTYEFRAPPRIGVVSIRAVRIVAFLVIVLSVFACAAVCIMAVWEVVKPDYAWRSAASLGIISATMAILVSLNEGFGPAVREAPMAKPAPPPPTAVTASA